MDPPAADPAVTHIPYKTQNAAWLNLFAPLVVVSLVLSVIALAVAVNVDQTTVIQSGPVAATGATSLSADLGEWDFVFDSPAIAADTDVPVTFTNVGDVEHNFAVLRSGADPADEARIDAGMIVADLGDVLPGETGSGSLNLSAGTYLVVCLIPGHFNSGMKAQLEVAA